MGLIPIIVLKLTEILQILPERRSRLGKRLEVFKGWHSALERSLGLEKENLGFSFQREVGFRDIAKVNWKSSLRSPLSFLPCRVSSSLPCSLFDLRFLSLLNG